MKRLLNKWPQKLLALTLAIVAWFSIDQNTRSTSQRELSVPVVVEGLGSDQTETGAPESVNVTLAGETTQVNRLRPENFDAVLDLSGLEGEYEETIQVVPPQGIRLLSLEPDTAIGVVESIRSKTVPVDVAVLGEVSENTVLEPLVEPSEVAVRGRSSTLERVQGAMALVEIAQEDGQETIITLYAVDAQNNPVLEVALEPEEVSVGLERKSILYTRTLPLEVTEPELGESLGLSDFSLSKPTLRVAGQREALDALGSVSALLRPGTQAPTTQSLSAGEYTLEVVPQLPEGVFSLERINASFSLTALPSEAPEAAPDDVDDNVDSEEAREDNVDDTTNPPDEDQEATSGEDNDSTSAPVRGPNSTQDSGSDNNF